MPIHKIDMGLFKLLRSRTAIGSNPRGQFDLIGVKLHPLGAESSGLSLLDAVLLVVVKDLYIIAKKEVEVDLVAIVADGGNKITFGVEQFDLIAQAQAIEVFA